MEDSEESELLCNLFEHLIVRRDVSRLQYIDNHGENQVHLLGCSAVNQSLLERSLEHNVRVAAIDGRMITNTAAIVTLIRDWDLVNADMDAKCVLRVVHEDSDGPIYAENAAIVASGQQSGKSKDIYRLTSFIKSHGTSISQSFSTPYAAIGTPNLVPDTTANGHGHGGLWNGDSGGGGGGGGGGVNKKRAQGEVLFSGEDSLCANNAFNGGESHPHEHQQHQYQQHIPSVPIAEANTAATAATAAASAPNDSTGLVEEAVMNQAKSGKRFVQLAIEDWKQDQLQSALRMAKRAHELLSAVHIHCESASGCGDFGNSSVEMKRVRRSEESLSPNNSPRGDGCHAPPLSASPRGSGSGVFWYHSDLVASTVLMANVEATLGNASASRRWDTETHAMLHSWLTKWRSRSSLQLPEWSDATTIGGIESNFATGNGSDNTSSNKNYNSSPWPPRPGQRAMEGSNGGTCDSNADREAVRGLSRCYEACTQLNLKMQLPGRALKYANASVHIWDSFLAAASATATSPSLAYCGGVARLSVYMGQDQQQSSSSTLLRDLVRLRSPRYCAYLLSPPMSASRDWSHELYQKASTLRGCATAHSLLAVVTGKHPEDVTTDHHRHSPEEGAAAKANNGPAVEPSLECLCLHLLLAHCSCALGPQTLLGRGGMNDKSQHPLTAQALSQLSLPLLFTSGACDPAIAVELAGSLKAVAKYLLSHNVRAVQGSSSSPTTPVRSSPTGRREAATPHFTKVGAGDHSSAGGDADGSSSGSNSGGAYAASGRSSATDSHRDIAAGLYDFALELLQHCDLSHESEESAASSTTSPSVEDVTEGKALTSESDTDSELQTLSVATRLAAGIFRDLTYLHYERQPPDYVQAEGHKRAEIHLLRELARFHAGGSSSDAVADMDSSPVQQQQQQGGGDCRQSALRQSIELAAAAGAAAGAVMVVRGQRDDDDRHQNSICTPVSPHTPSPPPPPSAHASFTRRTSTSTSTRTSTSAVVMNIRNNIAHSLWGLSHIVRKAGPGRAAESRLVRLEAIELLEQLIAHQGGADPNAPPPPPPLNPSTFTPSMQQEAAATHLVSPQGYGTSNPQQQQQHRGQQKKPPSKELQSMCRSLAKWRIDHRRLCERDHRSSRYVHHHK